MQEIIIWLIQCLYSVGFGSSHAAPQYDDAAGARRFLVMQIPVVYEKTIHQITAKPAAPRLKRRFIMCFVHTYLRQKNGEIIFRGLRFFAARK